MDNYNTTMTEISQWEEIDTTLNTDEVFIEYLYIEKDIDLF